MPVHTVMTPRPVCMTVTPDTTVDDFEREFAQTSFTRFPVIDEDENPVGYVHRGEIFRAKGHETMGALMHPLRGALDRHSVENAFQAMLRERSHINAVYDEHGGWMGIITLEDVMETILGQDIVDETDQVENMRRFARERWLSRLKRR
ncbi:CBS domain-containing protein [Verticiella alkaliphila]|uniref:CBS domain-containing protein n=1 Tax=Verticiella alkaliphila TaxID=2779529 RepID=UPI0035302999